MSAAVYIAPTSLDEAVEILQNQSGARLLAGGHALLLQANRARLSGAVLVDLGKIKNLAGVSLQADGSIQIGAMTTLDSLIRDELISTQYPSLAQAVAWIGDAQLRNRATVGGSIAQAHPESDLAALFMALGVSVNVTSGANSRVIAMDSFYTGIGTTALRDKEIITSFVLPASTLAGSVLYERMKHPATLYALSGVAVCAVIKDGDIAQLRVAATGSLTYPARMTTIENALVNRPWTPESIAEAVKSLPQGLQFRSDLFGSGDYRRHLLQVLTRRALLRALPQPV